MNAAGRQFSERLTSAGNRFDRSKGNAMERLLRLGTPADFRHPDGSASIIIGYRLTLDWVGQPRRRYLDVTEVLTTDGSIPATREARAALRKVGAL